MISIIKKCLRQIIDNIDAGNSNITEEEGLKLITVLKEYTDKDIQMSKYQAYQYLGVSRATFDNYVREGKLPKGKKIEGFKELSWSKKQLDEYIKSNK